MLQPVKNMRAAQVSIAVVMVCVLKLLVVFVGGCFIGTLLPVLGADDFGVAAAGAGHNDFADLIPVFFDHDCGRVMAEIVGVSTNNAYSAGNLWCISGWDDFGKLTGTAFMRSASCSYNGLSGL